MNSTLCIVTIKLRSIHYVIDLLGVEIVCNKNSSIPNANNSIIKPILGISQHDTIYRVELKRQYLKTYSF